MLPTLRAGQIVIAVRQPNVGPGDVVIISHQGREKIKRIKEVHTTTLFVLGDNPGASTDSRHFGLLPRSSLLGRVVWPIGL